MQRKENFRRTNGSPERKDLKKADHKNTNADDILAQERNISNFRNRRDSARIILEKTSDSTEKQQLVALIASCNRQIAEAKARIEELKSGNSN